ncbi:MAG: hypothetical protein LBJ92_00165 [Holosporales bacterium]|jgi:hypothetical protein|nr:hypothetical protein [Holosporales bacterium]
MRNITAIVAASVMELGQVCSAACVQEVGSNLPQTPSFDGLSGIGFIGSVRSEKKLSLDSCSCNVHEDMLTKALFVKIDGPFLRSNLQLLMEELDKVCPADGGLKTVMISIPNEVIVMQYQLQAGKLCIKEIS